MNTIIFIIFILVKLLLILIPLLLSVAYLTLAERKVLGAMQKRRGANVVGVLGSLQPITDGLKLLFKETIIPATANKNLFIFSPILTFALSILGWVVIPIDFGIVLCDTHLGILYLFAISSLSVYGIILAGWSSNSRYAFLGALRSTAQMISYEVSIGLIIVPLIICTGTLNLTQLVVFQEYIWFVIPFWFLFIMFLVSILAETNRPPFDLPEAEPELVAGYHVEYSSMGFALFFLGEYANMILMAAITTIFFLGGWNSVWIFYSEESWTGIIWFSIKFCLVLYFFIWVRAAYPRYRYDQLMRLGWKVFLPLSLGFLFLISFIIVTFHWYPTLM